MRLSTLQQVTFCFYYRRSEEESMCASMREQEHCSRCLKHCSGSWGFFAQEHVRSWCLRVGEQASQEWDLSWYSFEEVASLGNLGMYWARSSCVIVVPAMFPSHPAPGPEEAILAPVLSVSTNPRCYPSQSWALPTWTDAHDLGTPCPLNHTSREQSGIKI